MKKCSKCKQIKPIKEFHRNRSNKDGFQRQCRECHRGYLRNWTKTTLKGKRTAKRKQFPNAKRRGINKTKYNLMLVNQKGQCKICHRHISEFRKQFAVDHCHETGEVRSLLCANCNLALGHVKDNVVILKSMIKYLNQH